MLAQVSRMSPVVRQQLARGARAGASFRRAPFGEAVDDVAAALAEGDGHGLRVLDIDGVPVVLEVVDAPGGPLQGVVGVELGLAVPISLGVLAAVGDAGPGPGGIVG